MARGNRERFDTEFFYCGGKARQEVNTVLASLTGTALHVKPDPRTVVFCPDGGRPAHCGISIAPQTSAVSSVS